MSGADDRATDVELWSSQTNSPIVRVSGRQFPGVVVQGDSLSILFGLAMDVVERLPRTADANLRGTAGELAEKLRAHVDAYESVLQARGVALPYERDPRRVSSSPQGDAG